MGEIIQFPDVIAARIHRELMESIAEAGIAMNKTEAQRQSDYEFYYGVSWDE